MNIFATVTFPPNILFLKTGIVFGVKYPRLYKVLKITETSSNDRSRWSSDRRSSHRLAVLSGTHTEGRQTK